MTDERTRQWLALERQLQLDLFQDNSARADAAKAKLQELAQTPVGSRRPFLSPAGRRRDPRLVEQGR
jgi:hypothetical protein